MQYFKYTRYKQNEGWYEDPVDIDSDYPSITIHETNYTDGNISFIGGYEGSENLGSFQTAMEKYSMVEMTPAETASELNTWYGGSFYLSGSDVMDNRTLVDIDGGSDIGPRYIIPIE